MTDESIKQKTTSRYTYGPLDDFRILLGHAGIPHELYRSPKGKLFIRFDRPSEGDSVALQFRKEYTNYATRSVQQEHFRMFIGVYDDAVRQEIRTFEQIDDLVSFLGISPETILAGEETRSHLNRRLQAASVDEVTTKPVPPFMRAARSPLR